MKENNGAHKRVFWAFSLIALMVLVIGGGVYIRSRQPTQKVPIIRSSQITQTQVVPIRQRDRFIKRIAKPAVQNFERRREVLPSVVIAQAALESQFGTSALAKQAHNLFGVKGTYWGRSVDYETKEVENGHTVTVLAQFRKYPSDAAAIADHAKLLRQKFVKRSNLLSYRTTTRLIQENGYATDPHYAAKLNHLIVQYHLSQYDLKALNDA